MAFSLDEFRKQVDAVYAKHTAVTISAALAFGQEMDSIMQPLEPLPVEDQKAALAIIKLRERQMEREVTEACS
ncbi:hypothetical protein [Neorhizobium sp. AL 9.2.2]|uniref:hypothetical protein n=1 Tax=Neorhizobium sp. AL 9.2.2 TaxID=2712894 RepID=UPI00157424F1|nr:hypothetical protein [Neorhizobium sp. AL 9.2.2]NSY17250.1 hypothetical protein [Neorhizobium sp. AL 9.2.2]